MRTALCSGDPYGAPLVKFTLTFDGALPSTGNSSRKTQKKWEMRKDFHPQLAELWRVHPALKRLEHGQPYNPSCGGAFMLEEHHQHESTRAPRQLQDGEIDLCAPITKGGKLFKPLVRSSFALVCSLDINFLRNGPMGRVYQGGDLDGRIKTLLDALSVPAHEEQVIDDPTVDSPMLCLLEDDSLVTGINVVTERLLSRPNSGENEVRLTINIDVRVTDSRFYNALFLGD